MAGTSILTGHRTFNEDALVAFFEPGKALDTRALKVLQQGRRYSVDLWTPTFELSGTVAVKPSAATPPVDLETDLLVAKGAAEVVVLCETGISGAKRRVIAGRAVLKSDNSAVCPVNVSGDCLVPGAYLELRTSVVLARDLAHDGRSGARDAGSILWQDPGSIQIAFPQGETFWKPEATDFGRFPEEFRGALVHVEFSSAILDMPATEVIQTYLNTEARTFAVVSEAQEAYDRREATPEQVALVGGYQSDLLTQLALKVLANEDWVEDLDDSTRTFPSGSLGSHLRGLGRSLFQLESWSSLREIYLSEPHVVLTRIKSKVLERLSNA